MDTPRSGLRRARAVSWALAGLGVVAVAGTSTLAYADTVKPAATQVPLVSVDPAPPESDPAPALDVPVPPQPVTTALDTAPDTAPPVLPTPAPTSEPAAQPADPPRQTYEPAPSYSSEPAPSPRPTAQSHVPSTPPTTKRRNLTPAPVLAPTYSPHMTMSRGS